MADALNTGEIRKRSILGAKWLFIMNGLGMPSAFLIALMLGRTGPSVLGSYALVQILLGVISTFVVYGGAPVLAVFMPKIKDSEDRGRFVFTYLLLLLIFMALVLTFFWAFPAIFRFLIQRDYDMRNYGWFILLSVLIVATETFANTASGLMLIKVTAISRQMMRLILLPVVGLLYVFNRQVLLNHGMACIIGGFMAGYIISCLICVIGISRENRFKMRPGLFLPTGFWAFSLATMAATIFSFLYGSFDRLAVLSIQDVVGLGMYQAVISINHLIDIVPQMLGSTLVPMFSALLATGKRDSILKAYDLLQKAGSTMMTLAALFIIAYNREILKLFGENYVSYSYLLSLFCVTSSFRSLYFGNTPILIVYQKNAFRLLVSTVQISLQVVGTLYFLNSYGVLSIALSKIAGLLFAQTAGILYVLYGLNEGFKIPRTYKAGVLVTSVAALLQFLVIPSGIASSSAVFIIGLLFFYFTSGLDMPEFQEIAGIVLYKKKTIGSGGSPQNNIKRYSDGA